jgi:pSer/pThr/pTyr-binding forkhead associated (FHA) protein
LKLEIRNLQSSSSYEIDPEGAVLGREGSKADIILRDQAVSKKHAKIYEKNGRWYLEDLASSNGTFIDNRRITEPVVLSPGSIFALSENQFEVVRVINGRDDHAQSLDRDTEQQDSRLGGIDDLPPLGMSPPQDDDKRSSRQMPKNQSARSNNSEADDLPPPGGEAKGIGYFFIAVPKAIAFYMGAIPIMLFNPIGTIRRSAEEQKFPPMGRMELIAYALPPMVFLNLLGVIASAIVQLVYVGVGAMLSTLIAGSLVGAISAVIGSAVTGFIWHPFLNWLINFLKGESDEKSRTNYFICTYTAMALYGLPAAVTALMTVLMRIPYVGGFFGIVPPLINLAATGISLFVLFTWMKAFNVVAWVPKVIMVLGLLAVLGTGVGLVQAVIGAIKGLGGGGGSVAVASGDVEAAKKAAEAAMKAGNGAVADANEAIEAAKKAAEAAAKAGASPEQVEAMKKAAEAAAKAGQAGAQQAAEAAKKIADNAGTLSAEQKKAQEMAAEAEARAKEATAKAEKEAEKAAAKAEKEEKSAAKAEKKKPAKEEAAEEESETAGSAATPVAEMHSSKPVAPPLPTGVTQFVAFLQKREAVEKAISDDPGLLRKKDVLESYRKYLKKTFDVRKKWAKAPKDPVEAKINDHKKDLDVFEQTKPLVDELYSKVFH